MQKRRKKLKNRFFLYFLSIICILILLALMIFLLKSKQEFIPALSLNNFTKVSIEIESSNILLTSDCYRLTMLTTIEQTESISIAMNNITAIRPNAHDLFASSLKNFEISLLFVKIHSLIDGTYYARTFLKQGNNILVLDSRPSDAIAIALRVQAPIYLNEELLDYGEKTC